MDSNPYSGLAVDSITSFQEYIDKAKECGMKAIAFTEHGAVLHNIAKRQACEKAGIKYINAEEFYITESIEKGKLIRDNYHCCLFAKNYDGVRELNRLSSISMNRDDGHFYHNPRITFDELINTSDNILISTACVGGILCKGNEEIRDKFLEFIINNKHRCWLEIQPHNFPLQKRYNQYLYTLSQQYDLKVIATNDVHAVDKNAMIGRSIEQKAHKIEFHDEDECDLTWKTYEEMIKAFDEQSCLPKEFYTEALNETNNLADMIEPYELDYSKKYPRYDNSEQEFKRRIVLGIKERGINKLPNFKTEYIPRIQEELKTYKHNDAIDFMLLDADYKNWMSENNMHYGVSRGSVSGSLIAYLLHNTDVDSVKYDLNFSRFMNTERVSLADVDTDIYADDRYKVREYLFNKQGLYCCNIITFNTIQMKAAIKDVARALDYTPEQAQAISDSVEQDDNGKDFVPENIRNQYSELFKYVDMVRGTITSLGRHAAGIVCSPTDITYDFGTLTITSDPRPVSQIDMHEIDSLNYVKLDLLGLNAVGLIDKACKLAGINYLTPDNVDFSDENVINSIAEDTTLIFQFESGFASESLKKTLSKETLANIRKQNDNISYLDIMAMVNGAIRPAGESYREQLFNGIYKDNGNEALNNFLKPTLGFLVYQEQIIDFLHEFCGFTMGQADVVRRHFAKKTGTENDIPIIKNGGYLVDVHGNKDSKYIKGFIATAQEKYSMTKDEAETVIVDFLKVIEDASNYLFSRNHAVPYSMIGLFIGHLRYYHKLELLTAALNIYMDNDTKMASIKAYIKSQGISINGVKFGKSKADYFMDKENNSIYQGIGSIKYCNSQIADELYDLSNNHYDNFVDLLQDIKSKTSLNTRQLEILIKLNFFSDFGKSQKLLDTLTLYDKLVGKSQIKKVDIEKLGISDIKLFEKFVGSETKALYRNLDMIGYVKEVSKQIEDKPMSLKKQIEAEKEYLGYVDYINPNAPVGFYYVEEFKTYKDKRKPYVTLYHLKTGQLVKTRVINSDNFGKSPFEKGSVLNVWFAEQYKKKLVDGKWIKTEEKEKIMSAWEAY